MLGGRIGLGLRQRVGAGLLDWASGGVECGRAVAVPSCQVSPFLEGKRLVLAAAHESIVGLLLVQHASTSVDGETAPYSGVKTAS